MDRQDRPPPADRLILLLRASTGVEGLLIKGLLQSEGIPVLTKGESEGPYRMGPMDIWVPASEEVQARLILAEARSAALSQDPEDDTSSNGR